MSELSATKIERLLDLPFTSTYSDFAGLTLRGAFKALMGNLWAYGPDGFSPVRPFGNSDWQEQICDVLIDNGAVEDFDEAFELIAQLIKGM